MLNCLIPAADEAHESSSRRALTVLPSRTDQLGRHVSFDLFSKSSSEASFDSDDREYFKLETDQGAFRLSVSESAGFLSGDHATEYHSREDGVRTGQKNLTACHHLTGTVREETAEGEVVQEEGWVAISYCGGLVSCEPLADTDCIPIEQLSWHFQVCLYCDFLIIPAWGHFN